MTLTPKKIIFRADGNNKIGLGHIMRCVALIQIVQQDFECEFWTRSMDYFPIEEFNNRLIFHMLDADDTLEEEARSMVAQIDKNSIVVLDGYQFGTIYQKILKSSGVQLVCIDDIMAYHFVADAVINHAGGIQKENYSAEEYTKFYLGPGYALVKPLFYHYAGIHRDVKNKKILIALGGADPQNGTDEVIQKAFFFSFKEIHVMMGSANLNVDHLRNKYKNNGAVIFHQNLSSLEVCNLMINCPHAALAPSTVCYEYMTIGGCVYLFQIAENQEFIKLFFLQEKLAFSLDDLGELNSQEMELMIEKQRLLFDGKSPERLLKIFTDLVN